MRLNLTENFRYDMIPQVNSSTDNKELNRFDGEEIIKVPVKYMNQLNQIIEKSNSTNEVQDRVARLHDEALSYLYERADGAEEDQKILTQSAIASVETIASQKLKDLRSTIDDSRDLAKDDHSQYYTTLLEHSQDITTVIDRDGSIKYTNPAIERITGFTGGYVLNRNIFEFIHPKDREKVTRFYVALLHHKNNSNSIEFRLKNSRGGWLYAEGVGKNLLEDPIINGMIFNCRDISERKLVEKKLYRSIKQNKMLATRSRQIRENERHSIARELHDDLGQSLSILNMDIQLLDQKLQSHLDYKIRKEFDIDFENLHHSVQSIIETIQRIVYDLRPPILDNLGLDEAISWQAEKFKGAELDINLDTALQLDPPEPIKTGIFRIFQEMMTNIYRHSKAKNVTVITRSNANHISITVSDDGIGIPRDKVGGVKSSGLLGMQERTKEMKGKFSISSEPGKGTTISVKVPYNKDGFSKK